MYPSRHERGYGAAWVKLRKQAIIRDNGLCQPCLRRGRATPHRDVDHIKPKAKGGKDHIDNLQCICAECHKAKTRRENSGRVQFGEDGWPIGDTPEG